MSFFISLLSPCPNAKLPSGVAIAPPMPRPIPNPPAKFIANVVIIGKAHFRNNFKCSKILPGPTFAMPVP